MFGCSVSNSSSSIPESSSLADSVASVSDSSEVKEPIVESVGNLDYSDYIPKSNVPDDYRFFIEAEDCVLSEKASVLIDSVYGKFYGSGYVTGVTRKEPLSFTFKAEHSGRYDITVTGARDGNGAPSRINFGDCDSATFSFEEEGTFCDSVISNIYLEAGEYTVTIEDYTGTQAFDAIEIAGSKGVDLSIYKVSHKLSNPNANDTTQRLYNFLVDIYGKYTLTGQYSDSNAYPLDNAMLYDQSRTFKEIQRVCGDLPAILGLDLMECSPSRVAHGASEGDRFLTAAKAWDAEGGIVTIAWHWNAPDKYLVGSADYPWYRGFYTEATQGLDLAKIMSGEDQEGYDLILSDIDAIAVELQKLEDADIPVLWRPLHEAGGDPTWNNPWFWWGSGGAKAYKDLWILMYDRLTNHWGLDNLIWVWNGQNVSWYPGDEYCDMISVDIYADAYDYSSQDQRFNYILDSTETNKIVALSENGVLFDVDSAYEDGSRWAWFAVWSGEYAIDGPKLSTTYTSEEQWKKTYQSERSLTLSELPDWRCYPLAYED